MTFKEGEVNSPNRYFIDISPAQLNSALTGKEWAVESTALQKIRVAQFDASTVRIVLDGPSLKDVTASNLKDPNRIMVDVFTRAATAIPTKPTTTAAPVAPPASPSHSAYSVGLAVTSAWCESRDDYQSIAAQCRTGNVP